MTNTELTIDQLQAVSGGGVFAKLGDIKGEFASKAIIHPNYRQQKPGFSQGNRRQQGYTEVEWTYLGRRGLDVGPVN